MHQANSSPNTIDDQVTYQSALSFYWEQLDDIDERVYRIKCANQTLNTLICDLGVEDTAVHDIVYTVSTVLDQMCGEINTILKREGNPSRSNHNAKARHPADVIQTEVLEPNGLEADDLADRLGVEHWVIGRFLHERRPITTDLACRLALHFPDKPVQYWFDLQIAYDHRDSSRHLKPVKLKVPQQATSLSNGGHHA